MRARIALRAREGARRAPSAGGWRRAARSHMAVGSAFSAVLGGVPPWRPGSAPLVGQRRGLEQPLEVVLIVPCPDRRPQPRASGDVTHDHPALRQRGALGGWVRAEEGHEGRIRREERARARALEEQLSPAARRACARASARPASPRTRAPRSGRARRPSSRRPATSCQSAARPRGRAHPARSRGGLGWRSRVATPQALAQLRLTYSMPVPSGPHIHFCPAPAYASHPSVRTSTGPRRRPGRRRAGPARRARRARRARAAADPADVRAGDQARSAGRTAPAISGSGTSRTLLRAARGRAERAQQPRCSSSLVRISSPRADRGRRHVRPCPRSCRS